MARSDRTEYYRDYYKKNKRRIRQKYRENPTIKKEHALKYYKDNKKTRAEYNKKYAQQYKEVVNEKQRRYRKRLKEKIKPPKPNGLQVFHKRIDELNDVCALYWIVRKYAAITRYQNKRKRYQQLRKDLEGM
jgi:hypothetical protein